jgi:hypothetical protein
MKNSEFNRLNLQSNISSQILSNVKVRANVNLSAENRRTQPISTVIQNAMRMLPSISIYDDEGNYNGPTGNAELNGDALNPVAIVNEQKYRMKGFRMLSNISAEWEIIDGLVAKLPEVRNWDMSIITIIYLNTNGVIKSRPIPRNHCLRLMKSCICGIIHLLMTRYSANIN